MPSIDTGTVTVDWKLKTRGREGVVVGGRVKMGPHDCLIRPQDIELKTIRTIVVTPPLCHSGTSYEGSARQAIGSYVGYKQYVVGAYLGSIGALDTSRAAGTPGGNYARLRAVMLGSTAATYSGTAPPGSISASFLAFGE